MMEVKGKIIVFQFHPVRLKAGFLVGVFAFFEFQFHPVRLKEKLHAVKSAYKQVSIPSGAVKSGKRLYDLTLEERFNSIRCG